MSLVLQVSDPHFGTEQPAIVEALLALAREHSPDLVVLSGDITQRAHRSQFRAAQHFITHLGVPRVLVIPGNHDIPLFNPVARMFFPYKNYCQVFGEDLEPSYELDDLLVIGVNTSRPARITDGAISSAQIRQVCQRLQQASSAQLRIVVTHQPVHVIRHEDRSNLLHGHHEAVHAWAEAGADLIMGGHIHLPYVRPLAESMANLSRPLWAVQAGTAVSSRIRGSIANSINFVRTIVSLPRSCIVERWDHSAVARRFTLVESSILPLGDL